MPWLLDPVNLQAAWRRISTNDGALTPGVDGVTCRDIAPHVRLHLAQLADELRAGTYRPLPPRWVDIPKPSNPSRTRRLGILCIRDRLVHAAAKAVLEPLLEPAFAPTSFGFRPGRSVPAALAVAVRAASPRGQQPSPYSVGVHLDVADCFDSLDHRQLFGLLEQHVADLEFLRLLDRLFAVGGRSHGWFWRRRCGVVQGSSLSPLLCNLYLHAADEALAALASRRDHEILALRYADDLLILARDQALAREAIRVASRVLARGRLRLRNPAEPPRQLADGILWLGVVLRPRRSGRPGLTDFGYEIPGQKIASMFETVTELARVHRWRRSADELGCWLAELNDKLRQWHAAYALADNAAVTFRQLDAHTRDCVRRLGTPASVPHGRSVQRFRQSPTAGSWTWEAGGVQLLQLASLPPQNPHRRVRKPAWQQA
jgi:group II intron reverse transcriptase/maturase